VRDGFGSRPELTVEPAKADLLVHKRCARSSN